MISVNELRAGNWVRGISIGNDICIDLHFFNELFDHEENGDSSMSDYYSPINITPEILDKIGKRVSVGDSTEVGWIIKDSLYFLSNFQLQKGLHWFQNYHYFRTGQELIYKP